MYKIIIYQDKILFAYCKDKEFVLLSVFMKKTQKINKIKIQAIFSLYF